MFAWYADWRGLSVPFNLSWGLQIDAMHVYTVHMYVSHLIVSQPRPGIHAGRCMVCGCDSKQQHARTDVLQKTSANITTLCPFNTDTMCEYCVVMWECGRVNPYNRSILATPGSILFPIISANEAVTDAARPTWATALRRLDPTLPRVMVLTSDFKKRIWPRARVSQGDRLDILLHETGRGISNIVACSLERLLATLTIVEQIYALGFSKTSIEQGLFSVPKQVQKVGFTQTLEFEYQLQELRKTPELLPASIIAPMPEKPAK